MNSNIFWRTDLKIIVVTTAISLLPVLARAQTTTEAMPYIKPMPAPPAQPMPSESDEFDSPPSDKPHQQKLTKQEMNQFKDEMKNLGREATQMLKQMKGAAIKQEWIDTVQGVISQARECINFANKGASDETQQTINDCRGRNLWNDINDIRQEFVPPEEIKDVMRQINQNLKEVQRLKKQVAKYAGAIAAVDELTANIIAMQKAIQNTTGQDQRDAMQDFRESRTWDDIEKVRASVEVPKQLAQAERDLKRMQNAAGNKKYQDALVFFNVEPAAIQRLADDKTAGAAAVHKAIDSGNFEEARDLMNDNFHQSWWPGDLVGALDALREMHRALKSIRDESIRSQAKDLVGPVVGGLVAGDVRETNQILSQIRNQMGRYMDMLNRRPDGSDYEDRMEKIMSQLEELIDKTSNQSGNGKPSEGEMKKF